MSTVCVIKLEFFLQLKAAFTILSVIIKVISFLEKEDTLIKKRRRFGSSSGNRCFVGKREPTHVSRERERTTASYVSLYLTHSFFIYSQSASKAFVNYFIIHFYKFEN